MLDGLANMQHKLVTWATALQPYTTVMTVIQERETLRERHRFCREGAELGTNPWKTDKKISSRENTRKLPIICSHLYSRPFPVIWMSNSQVQRSHFYFWWSMHINWRCWSSGCSDIEVGHNGKDMSHGNGSTFFLRGMERCADGEGMRYDSANKTY